MIIIDCIQGSEEWFKARAGIPTASNFDKIITMKGEPSKQRTKYMYQLAGESILGTKEETYQNAAMQRGIELEDEARLLYEISQGVKVEEVGFCLDVQYGASPDGMVEDDGLVEIKCPSLAVHVEYVVKNELPSTYYQQVMGQLLVTGRKWCDFVSYYPGMKPFIKRVKRDSDFTILLEIELNNFNKERIKIEEKLR